MRSLSTLQAALIFAALGSVLAVFIPHFVANVHASRFNEPLAGLHHLATRASAHAAGLPLEQAYPGTVERTPAQVAAGQAKLDPPGTWSHPTWKLLGFAKQEPHYYSFEFESFSSAEGAHFYARSYGDLDGDGELSRFEIFGETRPGGHPMIYSVNIYREVE